MADWDKRLTDVAEFVAQWSKDTGTKVGAVIADTDNRIVSTGYNGLPAGCDDDIKSRYERPQKYLWTEHAERNAIYSAAKNGVPLKGCSIYLKWFPCADCARAIIQSGITKVVCTQPDLDTPKWGEHFKIALDMFHEIGIQIVYIS